MDTYDDKVPVFKKPILSRAQNTQKEKVIEILFEDLSLIPNNADTEGFQNGAEIYDRPLNLNESTLSSEHLDNQQS